MSVTLQFNHFMKNKTARKAMEKFAGFLGKAFEQYQDLWEDYIKLQEKYEQCNVSPVGITIDEPCVTGKDEEILQQQLNSGLIIQESDNVSLLELDTDAQNYLDVNMVPDYANLSEDFLGNSPPKSPVFSKAHPETNSISAINFMQSLQTASVCSKSPVDTKMCNNEKVPSKYNQKLELSTTYHVETTFLPNGKKLKQSRLVFQPAKCDKEKMPILDVDKLKSANTILKVKQEPTDTLVTRSPITITIGDNTAKANETFIEDVTQISPTQRNVQSQTRHCLKLKRKIPRRTVKNSPDKNKYHNFKSKSITKAAHTDDIDFNPCLSPVYTSAEMKYESLAKGSNTADTLKYNVNIHSSSSKYKYSEANIKDTSSIDNQRKGQTVQDKVQMISLNLNNSYEETFYLPAEQTINKNSTNDLNLNDIENKSPAKKSLLNKSHILSRRKENVSEQLNMRRKADREKLSGWACWKCEKYYKDLLLSKEELQERKNQCSRHRHKYERPNTPEGFWDPEFPETSTSTYRYNIN